MKRAVFYYTYDGSSAVAAGIIAQKTGADIIELEEAKPRKKGGAAFMRAAFGALFGAKSRLKPGILEKAAGYEGIIVISPVWASKTVPAVNSLLAQKLSGKEVWAVTVQADPDFRDSAQVLDSIRSRAEAAGATWRGGAAALGAAPGKTASAEDMPLSLGDFISGLQS
jgi:hypothetical protein